MQFTCVPRDRLGSAERLVRIRAIGLLMQIGQVPRRGGLLFERCNSAPYLGFGRLCLCCEQAARRATDRDDRRGEGGEGVGMCQGSGSGSSPVSIRCIATSRNLTLRCCDARTSKAKA